MDLFMFCKGFSCGTTLRLYWQSRLWVPHVWFCNTPMPAVMSNPAAHLLQVLSKCHGTANANVRRMTVCNTSKSSESNGKLRGSYGIQNKDKQERPRQQSSQQDRWGTFWCSKQLCCDDCQLMVLYGVQRWAMLSLAKRPLLKT